MRYRLLTALFYATLVITLGCLGCGGDDPADEADPVDGLEVSDGANLPSQTPGEAWMNYVRAVRSGDIDEVVSLYSKAAIADLEALAEEMSAVDPAGGWTAETFIAQAVESVSPQFNDEAISVVSEFVNDGEGTAELQWKGESTPEGEEGFIFFVAEDGKWKITTQPPGGDELVIQ